MCLNKLDQGIGNIKIQFKFYACWDWEHALSHQPFKMQKPASASWIGVWAENFFASNSKFIGPSLLVFVLFITIFTKSKYPTY